MRAVSVLSRGSILPARVQESRRLVGLLRRQASGGRLVSYVVCFEITGDVVCSRMFQSL